MEMMINEQRLRKEKAQRNLMYLGLFTIVMLFAGLTSAYVVRRDGGDWFMINLPPVFLVSTVIILLSSLTINFAVSAFKKDNTSLGTLMMGLTLVLGIGFVISQFAGYRELAAGGVYLVHAPGQSAMTSGSFIYLLTLVHLAHLAFGILSLIFTFIQSLRKKYNSSNTHGVRVCSIYWHFLDGLWIYLFLFLTIFK
jgi:cytochrome c oxidase subunit III